jgi:hypothetical protein
MGALIFAWHAAHVEAVCWTAASFDLLATFFCLLTLLLVPTRFTPIMLLTAALACLSKESAYCLPLLVACSALLCDRAQRRGIIMKSLWVALSCAAVFACRFWYLHGIGGYRTGSGAPMVFSLHPLSIAQALLLRLWALLLLPLNWSVGSQIWLSLAMTLMLCALCFMTVQRGKLSAALLFTLCAAIPVFPLLLIGFDLSGARVLYLPSVGIGLFWAMLASDERSLKLLAFVALFQLSALLHNEFIWKQESELATQACVQAAQVLKRNPALHIYAADMPKVRHGVYFLGNGFSGCVAQAGDDLSLAQRISSRQQTNDTVLTWDNTGATFKVSSAAPYLQK